ncbi:Rmf/CrpP fold protein [Streptomyces kasugaensis]|uniref:Rmf/CrpP fold protein n=1 Tax=Streptomyces kasugaensis TaxID=1946 RepID=UPI0013EF77A8|nr:Rmf/CrpP fold protein [Streptomyces kasugaensis]
MDSREQLVHAVNEGNLAGRNGTARTACPYPSGDLRRTAWIRGYNKANSFPIDDEG